MKLYSFFILAIILVLPFGCSASDDDGGDNDDIANEDYTLGDSIHIIEFEGMTWIFLVYIPQASPTGHIIFPQGLFDNGPDFCNDVRARNHADQFGFVAACPTEQGKDGYFNG